MATKNAQETKWEAEDAARTLIRAEEIKANKQLFVKAQKELAKQQKAVSKAMSKTSKKK